MLLSLVFPDMRTCSAEAEVRSLNIFFSQDINTREVELHDNFGTGSRLAGHPVPGVIHFPGPGEPRPVQLKRGLVPLLCSAVILVRTETSQQLLDGL